MSKKLLRGLLTVSLLCGAFMSTGCLVNSGPQMGVLGVPIPVSPMIQVNKENQYWEHERYGRVPILGPLTAGGPTAALDEPSDDEVMIALEHADPVAGGIPFLHERQRDNVRIIKEKIADYIDPPRVIPLIGPVQLHHSHWKCTVFYTELVHVGWPFPHTIRDEESSEVIYIDHNHFHMVGDVDTGPTTTY